MDEDSLSRDGEPFWSDGEEESTDGQWRPPCPPARSSALLTFLFPLRLAERGRSPAATAAAGRGHGPAGVLVPPGRRRGAGPLAARVCAGVELQREPLGSGGQRRTGERRG